MTLRDSRDNTTLPPLAPQQRAMEWHKQCFQEPVHQMLSPDGNNTAFALSTRLPPLCYDLFGQCLCEWQATGVRVSWLTHDRCRFPRTIGVISVLLLKQIPGLFEIGWPITRAAGGPIRKGDYDGGIQRLSLYGLPADRYQDELVSP